MNFESHIRTGDTVVRLYNATEDLEVRKDLLFTVTSTSLDTITGKSHDFTTHTFGRKDVVRYVSESELADVPDFEVGDRVRDIQYQDEAGEIISFPPDEHVPTSGKRLIATVRWDDGSESQRQDLTRIELED